LSLDAMILYRPVGLEEMRLVYESGLRVFPPRLPEQPIFYPVLDESYAAQIAREWNAPSGTQAGYVTRFEVEDDFVRRYEVRQVGSRRHVELWVPAEELGTFNRHIAPPIRVIDSYFGDGFEGVVPVAGLFAGRNAVAQIVRLDAVLDYSAFDFVCEVAVNHVAVFLHFPFWASREFGAAGVPIDRRDRILSAISRSWTAGRAETPLPECAPRGSPTDSRRRSLP
jgi:hypothetical protein